MARYGIVSILPSPRSQDFPTFDSFYRALGSNTGNLLFTNAVWQLLKGTKGRLNYFFDPAKVNGTYDTVVIPAANWIQAGAEHDAIIDQLAGRISQLRIPVVVIGIGAQLDQHSHPSDLCSALGPGVRRLLRVVSDKSASISLRGEVTQKVLSLLGFHNGCVTGCPSLSFETQPFPMPQKSTFDAKRSLVHSTRYAATKAFARTPSIHRELYRFAYQQQMDVILQSEREELALLFGMSDPSNVHSKNLAETYGATDLDSVRNYILERGRAYLDVAEWSRGVRDYQFAFGTRLHSTIMCLNSGVTAALACHDSRTEEVAEFAAIPRLDLNGQSLTPETIKRAYEQADTDKYYARRREIREIYNRFLTENGLALAAAPVADEKNETPEALVTINPSNDGHHVPTDQFARDYDVEALKLIAPTECNFSMWLPPRYAYAFASKTFEATSAQIVRRIVSRADLFIDVGAHCGFYSLLAAETNPDLDIIAVEPTPETVEILRKNVEYSSADNVVVRQAAATSDSGEITLFKSAASDNCGLYQHPAAPTVGRFKVAGVTVDELVGDRCPQRLVVKIDTEGHELAVLRGMHRTLERVQDVRLIIEINPLMLTCAGSSTAELLDLLEEYGFAAFLIDEATGRLARATPSSDVIQRMQGADYGNLYCLRKAMALSVTFFSHSSQLGGAERHLLDLVTDLVRERDVIATVVLPENGPLLQKLTDAGAASIVAPGLSWWASPTEWGHQDAEKLSEGALATAERVVPQLSEISPDVIFTQTSVIPWGAAAAAILGVPHVWSICEFGEADHGLSFASGFRQRLEEIQNGATLIVTNSDAVREALFPDLGPERVQTVYQHIDVQHIDVPGPVEEDATSPTGPWLHNGSLRLGLFGTLIPSKGQVDAIQAVALLGRHDCNAELVLAGYGESDYSAELKRLAESLGISDRVHLVGFVSDPFVLMRQTDVVLVCSRNEAFGRTAVEAMQLEKPVVYTRAGGVQEFMIDGETGLGYAVGNVDELAAKIALLWSDQELRRRIGHRAREHAAMKFSSDGFGGAIWRLLQTARASKAPRVSTPVTVVQATLAAMRRTAKERDALLRARAQLQREVQDVALQLAQSRQQLDHIKQSASWRLTKPVRSVRSQLGKFALNRPRKPL